MGLLEIIVIAVGLSMDAFAVSVTLGLLVKKPKLGEIIVPGVYFGFFQALMSFTGYFAGTYFAKYIQHLDHWVVFAFLGFIGGKMIKDSFSKEREKPDENQFQPIKMLFLAIATSIDALAVGITFSFFEMHIFTVILIIGLTTFFISIAGVKAGNIFGILLKSKAELFGGVVLILIGLKVLIEHLCA
jgi:putative Mn2+ efflux pump MntP